MSTQIYNPQWDKYMDVPLAFVAYMKANGFEPWHTGGGCMAWACDGLGDKAESFLLITVDGSSLGEWDKRDQALWNVGYYAGGDDDDKWVCWNPNISLAEAIRIGTQVLPNLIWQ
jgi:hypothetical protein